MGCYTGMGGWLMLFASVACRMLFIISTCAFKEVSPCCIAPTSCVLVLVRLLTKPCDCANPFAKSTVVSLYDN